MILAKICGACFIEARGRESFGSAVQVGMWSLLVVVLARRGEMQVGSLGRCRAALTQLGKTENGMKEKVWLWSRALLWILDF